MDLGLPPDPDGATEGLATLQQILACAPDTKVIVLTGNQDHAHAVKAISLGAYDFHQNLSILKCSDWLFKEHSICTRCNRKT